jgi:hypothetical protein
MSDAAADWSPPGGVYLADERHRDFVRGVGPYRPRAGCLLAVGCVFGGMGLAWTALLVGFLWQHARLQLRGVTTEGEVTGSTSRSEYRSRGGSATVHSLAYRYRVGDADLTGSQDVSADKPARHPPGTKVTVRYLPDDPGVSRLVGGDLGSGDWSWSGYVAGGCFTLLPLAFVWFGGLRVLVWRRRQRLTQGRALPATFLSGELELLEGRRQRRLRVRFRFTAPGGKEVEGEETVTSPATPPRPPRPGEEGRVVFVSETLYALL